MKARFLKARKTLVEVKIREYKNKLSLPIFMTMRDIVMVEIYGVNFAVVDVMKEAELSVAAMKKQKAKYMSSVFYNENLIKILDQQNQLLHLKLVGLKTLQD